MSVLLIGDTGYVVRGKYREGVCRERQIRGGVVCRESPILGGMVCCERQIWGGCMSAADKK